MYVYVCEREREREREKYILLCISISMKVKLVTLVEGDLKAPFSIATTPMHRGRHYSFPWIAPLYP